MPRRRAARRGYWTDLSEAQWAVIAPLVPDAKPGGRPRKASSRELVNAILYALRAGCSWRLLPADFPPWQTVTTTSSAGDAKAFGHAFITLS